MKKCLADIVKVLAFEMVERLGSTKEKDIINDFKYTYLKLTYYISKNRKLEIFRVDNDCRRKKCDFIVDYFKVYDVAKYMVVRYYDNLNVIHNWLHQFTRDNLVVAVSNP